MPHSFSQTTPLTCPECQQPFTAELWLIVDVDERPDLLERILNDTLHDIACPNGHAGALNAPLLVYRPGAEPPLIFSPARRTSAEQDRQQAGALLGLLRERLGSAWQESWLGQVALLPRDFLALALREGVQAAYRQIEALAERASQLSSEPEEPDLSQARRLLAEAGGRGRALLDWLNAENLQALRQGLEAEPLLLEDETLALLQRLMEVEPRPPAQAMLRARRDLLRRCQQVGMTAAFDELGANG